MELNNFNTMGVAIVIVLLLIQLGVFARKEDTAKLWTALAELRTLLAREYVHKDALWEIKEMIRELNQKLERLIGGHHP